MNSASDENQSDERPVRRSRWSAAIETFSPAWFAVVMDTGILSTIMHQLPYQFRGLHVLSTITFVLAVVLMITFVLVQLARVFFFPRSMLRQTTSNMEELCMWGCAPIALLTITAQLGLTASQAAWGGHAFTIVAYVFWWVSTALMLASSLVIYITLMEFKAAHDITLPAAVFIPAVGTTTDAVVGALITTYSSDMSPRLAVPVIVTGWLLLGYGFFVAVCVYAIFFVTLFMRGFWLPPAKWPSFLILVGPMGQCGSALQLLASAAAGKFAGYDKGTFLTSEATSPIESMSTVIGLLFVGFDLFWLFIAIYIVIKGAVKRAIPFSMVWWSTIFPVSTLNISFLALSISLDSPAFRVLTTGLFLILLIDYFVCWAFTLYSIWTGKLLDGRQQLEDMASKQS